MENLNKSDYIENIQNLILLIHEQIDRCKGTIYRKKELKELDIITETLNYLKEQSDILIDILGNNELPKELYVDIYNTTENAAQNISLMSTDYIESNLEIKAIMDELSELLNYFVRERNNLLNFTEITKKNNKLIKEKKDDIDSAYEEYKRELHELKLKSTEDAKKIEDLRDVVQDEIKALNEKYKTDLASFESKSQSLTFKDASTKYEKSASKWNNAVILLTLVLFILIPTMALATWIDFSELFGQLRDDGFMTSERINAVFYYEIFSKSILRLLFISLMAFLIKFSVKNYNAAKHNMIINLHKANSLATAARLITTSPDNETFNSIITMAAKEIFSQPRTGYLHKDNTKTDVTLLGDLVQEYIPKTKLKV